jgi:hypothetical protein
MAVKPTIMRVTLGAVVLLVGLAACAHPQGIRTVSKEQEALLASFKTALEEVRTRVRAALNESIEDYQEARLRSFVLTETGVLTSRILRCTREPGTCEGKSPRVLLDEAAEYLARAQATLFTDSFCSRGGTWDESRTPWMRRDPSEPCLSKPREIVQQLEQLREALDKNLARLAREIAAVQEGHAIIDKFLQIRIEIRKEDVAAANETMKKAAAAITEVSAALRAVTAGQAP